MTIEPELLPCIRSDPHPPHDWRYDLMEHGKLVHCPGVPELEEEKET